MRPFIAPVVFLALAGSAWAQTTKPAEQQWVQVVKEFTRAVAAGEDAAVAPLLSSSLSIRAFDSRADSLAALMARAGKGQLLGAHADMHEPLSMAAALAADFKTATDVPEQVKRHMVPANDAEMTRANATAVQWLSLELQARSGDPVAVITLWCSRAPDPLPRASDPGAVDMEPIFILLKGEETTSGQFRIKTVVFGNPLPAN